MREARAASGFFSAIGEQCRAAHNFRPPNTGYGCQVHDKFTRNFAIRKRSTWFFLHKSCRRITFRAEVDAYTARFVVGNLG